MAGAPVPKTTPQIRGQVLGAMRRLAEPLGGSFTAGDVARETGLGLVAVSLALEDLVDSRDLKKCLWRRTDSAAHESLPCYEVKSHG